ncbi:MAG: hypothetical protein AAF414_22900 [Pseudomonadota bacterium]
MASRGARLPAIICATLLIVTFFLPWIQAFAYALSGFDMALMPLTEPMRYGGPLYALWLVPLFSLLAVLFAAIRWGPVRLMAGFSGLVLLLVFGYFMVMGRDIGGTSPVQVIGFGLWIAVISALAALLVALGILRVPTSQTPKEA